VAEPVRHRALNECFPLFSDTGIDAQCSFSVQNISCQQRSPEVEAESSSNENDGKLIVSGEKQTGDVAVTRPAAAVLSLHEWRSVCNPRCCLSVATRARYVRERCLASPFMAVVASGAGRVARKACHQSMHDPSVHPSPFSCCGWWVFGELDASVAAKAMRRLVPFGERARGGRHSLSHQDEGRIYTSK
jgi:hypothetical protein